MIDGNVAAAFRAVATIADVAALKSGEKLRALYESHIFFLPQGERAHRRGGITPAVFAMAVTHLQGFAAHLDLHRSAVTSAFMRLCHDSNINQESGEAGSENFMCRFPRFGF